MSQSAICTKRKRKTDTTYIKIANCELTIIKWGTGTHFHFNFAMPYTVNVNSMGKGGKTPLYADLNRALIC